MARNKSDVSEMDSDGKGVGAWDYEPQDDRVSVQDIVASRSRNDVRHSIKATTAHKGRLYFDKSKIPAHLQYGYIRTRLDNQDDIDNFTNALDDGWVPVAATDHPELNVIDIFNDRISERFPGSIRKGGMMLMKKPKDMYLEQDAYYRDEALQNQEASEALTQFADNNSFNARVVENDSKFTRRTRG